MAQIAIEVTVTDPQKPVSLFGVWWCEIQGITKDSPSARKLYAYMVLDSLQADIPTFLIPYKN